MMATDELRKALGFMRIWLTEDAHLGESAISRELEKAEGLRKLDAIEQAIAAWNARAQVAANDNLPAETAISADGHARNDTETTDSRERLEADICECINARSWGMNHDYMISRLVEWLDRQAAITERDVKERPDCQKQVDSLTAERDELRKERDRWHVEQVHAYGNWEDAYEYAKKLEAERDELQSIIDHMPKTEAECEACQEAHDRLMFNAKADMDELRDELKHKQLVIDRQRDSFLKMERECAELRRMLADAAEAI